MKDDRRDLAKSPSNSFVKKYGIYAICAPLITLDHASLCDMFRVYILLKGYGVDKWSSAFIPHAIQTPGEVCNCLVVCTPQRVSLLAHLCFCASSYIRTWYSFKFCYICTWYSFKLTYVSNISMPYTIVASRWISKHWMLSDWHLMFS